MIPKGKQSPSIKGQTTQWPQAKEQTTIQEISNSKD
jgi:hypothetical protein